MDKLLPTRKLITPPLIEVFDENLYQHLCDSKNPRIREMLLPLDQVLPTKALAIIPANWRVQLEDLEARFPNFSSFIQGLRESFAVNDLGDGRVAFTPMLLDGPPGVGKTEIALTLAQMLDVDMVHIDMANAQSNGALCGLERFYTDAHPGTLFNNLTQSRFANPLIFLDELDKVARDHRYSPDSGLYTLLEKNTAKRFYDLAVPELILDASHVLWLATSNCAEHMPSPIRDRFTVFSIPAPSPEQLLCIIRYIYRDILDSESWGDCIDPELDEAVLLQLSHLAPRQIKKALYAGCGRAVFDGRFRLNAVDVANHTPQGNYGAKIGFV